MLLDKIIFFSYATLFFLVPLIFSPFNFELFEFNKMLLVYLLTVVITGTWLLKMLQQKKLIFNRTPLDIPLLLFLVSQILSTIFSIDTHTSIFGYYSRLNGGLLSLVSYLLLYFAFVSNIPKEKINNLLKIALSSGAIVAVWGILEHFGVSPSCVILQGEFNASCWVQDVQARVFATLGQPNWMAGYLGMLIFPALYFFLTSKTKLLSTNYYLLSCFYFYLFQRSNLGIFRRNGSISLSVIPVIQTCHSRESGNLYLRIPDQVGDDDFVELYCYQSSFWFCLN